MCSVSQNPIKTRLQEIVHTTKTRYRTDMKSCLRGARILLKCVITRFLFMMHLLLVVWRVWETYDRNHWHWCLFIPVFAMLAEMAVVLYKRDGHEWRRFCPSYFFYLLGAVPSVWFIELDRLETIRIDENAAANSSTTSLDFGGFSLSVTMTTTEWAIALEQSMMFLLIIGRWMLPKGEMSREQLSQLLLVYLGMAIDIIELFEMFKEVKVLNNQTFIYIVLGAFSWSLLQFTFLLTPPPKKRRPTRNQVVDIEVASAGLSKKEDDKLLNDRFSFIYDEKFAIFVSLFMQDLPFLVIRIVSIAHFQVYSYANTFFTVKNAIMVLLQLYRLLVLACERINDDHNDEGDDDIVAMENKRNEGKFPSDEPTDSNGAGDSKAAIVLTKKVTSKDPKIENTTDDTQKLENHVGNGGVVDLEGNDTYNPSVNTKPPRPLTGKRVSRPQSGRPMSARPMSARPVTPSNGDTRLSDDSGIGGDGGEQKGVTPEPSDLGENDAQLDAENEEREMITNSDDNFQIGRPRSRGSVFFSDEKPPSAMRRSVTPSRKSVTFFDHERDSPAPTLESRRSVTPRPGTPGAGGRRSALSSANAMQRSVTPLSKSVKFHDDDDGDDDNIDDDDQESELRGSPTSIATYRTDMRSVTPSRKSVTFMDDVVDNEGRASRITRPGTPVHTKQKKLEKVLGRRGVAKHKPISAPSKTKKK